MSRDIYEQVPATAHETVDGATADSAPSFGTNPVVAGVPTDVTPAQDPTADEVSGYLYQTGGGLLGEGPEDEEEIQV